MSGHDTAEATVETPLHRAPAEVKVLATVLFVIAVALIPRGRLVWPYAVDAALLIAVAVLAATPVSLLAGRLAIEAPFVLFVVLLPFVVHDGAWLAFGIAAKATLAVLAEGRERLALVPEADVPAGFDTVVLYKAGRELPALLREHEHVVYGEDLGTATERLTPPDGPAPYMSTVIVK